MKLNSKYFDSIRASGRKPSADDENAGRRNNPPCQWKGCEKPGPHRAPMGRGRDGEYFHFCIDHVRQYNATYNYFDGMSDAEVSDFQKDALTGHRPTWKVGANAWANGSDENVSDTKSREQPGSKSRRSNAFFDWRAEKSQKDRPRRSLRPIEKKSLDALHLTETATREEIKARFKELVKRHHPDANGGDTRSEDTLREIIQAYNYLKQAGLV